MLRSKHVKRFKTPYLQTLDTSPDPLDYALVMLAPVLRTACLFTPGIANKLDLWCLVALHAMLFWISNRPRTQVGPRGGGEGQFQSGVPMVTAWMVSCSLNKKRRN